VCRHYLPGRAGTNEIISDDVADPAVLAWAGLCRYHFAVAATVAGCCHAGRGDVLAALSGKARGTNAPVNGVVVGVAFGGKGSLVLVASHIRWQKQVPLDATGQGTDANEGDFGMHTLIMVFMDVRSLAKHRNNSGLPESSF